MAESGNFVRDDSFISLMLTLRANIMSTLHVADIVRVIGQNTDSTYTCCRFDDESKVITCLALENLTIFENDICLVLYCDHDFRSNLKKLQANSKTVISETSIYHSVDYGVIIGHIIKQEEE